MMVALFIVLLPLSYHVCAASFTSTQNIALAFDVDERYLVNALEALINQVNKHVDAIERFINEYEPIEFGSRSFLEHPINGYHILTSLVNGWQELQQEKKNLDTLLKEAFGDMTGYRNDSGFPEEKDFNLSSDSFLIAAEVYDVDIPLLSEGKIRDIKNSETVYEALWSLKAEDCLYFADRYMNGNFHSSYYKAVLWTQEALRKVINGDKSEPEGKIQDLLEEAILIHDLILHTQGPRGVIGKTHTLPFSPDLANHRRYQDNLVEVSYGPTKLYQELEQDETIKQCNRLCRGEPLLPASVTKHLSCRYVRDGHAYFYLRPLKLEEHSLDPYIAVFHDFLSNTEIENFIKASIPEMNESEFVLRYDTGTYRTSNNAWLEDSNITDPISARIEKAVGLNALPITSSELYQVANYGIGGQYQVHHDYLQHIEEYTEDEMANICGDRIATFMIYLSDVEAGGATVFPQAGVTVWPKKGSAAFWWNLYRNGDEDPQTIHAGCPVLKGSKWIANKWMHAFDQMFVAKCGLDRFHNYKDH